MKRKSSKEEIKLEIRGMTCDSCAVHVTKALKEVKGILHVELPDWTSKQATVIGSENIKDQDLITAVEKAGYQVDVRKREKTNIQPYSSDAFDYDLIVIGTGGAGMAAAIKGAELGQKIGIIEGGTIGGTCVNNGCVPSKTLIRAAELFHKAGHHSFEGVHIKTEKIDWQSMIHQKDSLVTELRQSKYLDVLASYGDRITLLQGQARFGSDGTIVLEGKNQISSKKIVIATGARPKSLLITKNVDVFDSTAIMELKEIPKSLLIVGGRAIALELGQMFVRLGTEVTILQRSSHILPTHEHEITELLTQYLSEEGLKIHTNVRLLSLKEEANAKVVLTEINGEQQEFRAQAILMATGKTPNTKELGLEAINVKLDKDGFIIVNEFLQTSNPNIYAAGDVTTHPKFVYVAARAGGLAAENALNGNYKKFDLTILPSVVFTDPQVAHVGLTEKEAKNQGYKVKATTLPLSYVPRAITARDTRGMIKLIADASSDRLLGAHVLASEGGELIQSAALLVKFGRMYGATVQDFIESFVPYLTQVEGLKLAALTFDKDVSKLSCCAG
ncbi:MAG: mercury(II) reductase [Candidatus Hodarchaeales archaeon]|jgi:mercuric reductase